MTGLFSLALVACGQEAAQQAPEQTAVTETPPAPASPAERLEQVKMEMASLKTALADSGAYQCCVNPPCDWCLLKEGSCSCHGNLTVGKEVCADCGLGWHNGEGSVEGVKAADVKWNITHEHPAEGGHKH
jgi:hypothetical protein